MRQLGYRVAVMAPPARPALREAAKALQSSTPAPTTHSQCQCQHCAYERHEEGK